MVISKNKTDLMIEVWERLDCENVGASEIIAIEDAIRERFGPAGVESPMRIARHLADEGAELRHAEIMVLYLERASNRPYDAPFRNLLSTGNLREARSSLRRIENLRMKFESEGDVEGMRLLRQKVIEKKMDLLAEEKTAGDLPAGQVNAEIATWFTIWLQSPELFHNWISLRQRSQEFAARFGNDQP
jgi:hypothetical protein